jgi:hypothetical protein
MRTFNTFCPWKSLNGMRLLETVFLGTFFFTQNGFVPGGS